MRQSLLSALTAVTLIVCPTLLSTARAADKLFVQTPAAYGGKASVDSKIKQECKLEDKVSAHLQDQLKGTFDVVPSRTLSDAGGAKSLSLSIVNVQGVGGGAWSGPKGLALQGTLKQGGKTIGSFNAQRTSTGGAFGGYKSTCSIFERCTKELGKDVAKWLAAPTMDAKLGELK
jgi:hypothetical protein